jgi:hypothetical protein
MRIEIIPHEGIELAEILSDKICIRETQDALDLMAECDYSGSRKIIIRAEYLVPEFFDLKTGLAGDILQKFSTYDYQLAIIGDFRKYTSRSLQDFIRESNRQGRIFFAATLEEARKQLSR